MIVVCVLRCTYRKKKRNFYKEQQTIFWKQERKKKIRSKNLLRGDDYFMNYHRCLFTMKNLRPKSQVRFYHEYHHNLFKVPYKKPGTYWECKIGIQPLEKGIYKFNQIFSVKNRESIFDGIQSFLLTPS